MLCLKVRDLDCQAQMERLTTKHDYLLKCQSEELNEQHLVEIYEEIRQHQEILTFQNMAKKKLGECIASHEQKKQEIACLKKQHAQELGEMQLISLKGLMLKPKLNWTNGMNC